jgi:hypothetical protein
MLNARLLTPHELNLGWDCVSASEFCQRDCSYGSDKED